MTVDKKSLIEEIDRQVSSINIATCQDANLIIGLLGGDFTVGGNDDIAATCYKITLLAIRNIVIADSDPADWQGIGDRHN